jgi:acetylornithine deacetylase/succinyl-diaminopimelate desuccinylase-like protein
VLYGEVESPQPDAFTLLFYGHYDVQPPEPLEEWDSPPFEPIVREGRLWGRGVADNKGQLLTHVLAVKSYLAVHDSLPVNVKFVFEGEEESGSVHLPEFIEEHRDLLAADLVYTSDGPLHETGDPVVFFGVRGILNVELRLRTAEHDNHSGNKGGVVPNAAWELVDVLSTMKDEEDRVLIPGFYDDVLPPDEASLQLIEDLPYDPDSLAEVFGVEQLGLSKEEYYRRLTLRPTLTINGLVSGYTGPGSKTIIPGQAVAKLDMRLVADQDPEKIFEMVKAHVSKVNPDVEVVHHGHMYPSRTRPDLPAGQKVVRAVEAGAGEEPIVTPALGGSLPDYVWTKLVGLPSVGVPYANADEANHAPNENMEVDLFYRGIRVSAQVMHELGR